MSGPFRFNGEEAKSPLDRSASPFAAGQPVSFKTNVNRMKTKKWVQAKKNAYDGDDWGDYDEYDEYGVNQDPPQPEPQRYYAQQPSRSFTDPTQQVPLPKARRNSFEHGEEQRAFSSSIPHPQQGHGQYYEDAHIQGSGPNRGGGYDEDQMRDFSPSVMPHPLQTHFSQVPADVTTSPANTQFPPRKSSIGQGQSPVATSPQPHTGTSDKPLPFIRPADIYRRVEEERVRERASLDSSRPSLDSLSSRPKDDPIPPQVEGNKSLHPLETVAERKSEYLPAFDATYIQNSNQPAQAQASVVSPPDDQGFRSVVDRAFVRNDDQRSIPPTPISKESSSEISRTNSDSTYGISPIMSRVPSSATSAMKNRDQTGAEGNTPAIAEEPGEMSTPVPQPTSSFAAEPSHHLPQQTTTGHSRNFSGSSLPRSGFATPTRGDSPARSPVVAPQQNLPEPESAQFANEGLHRPDAMEGGLAGPSSAYAHREADIATAMQGNPTGPTPELGAAERHSRNVFLESHNAQSPIQDVIPRDRSESPNKGRVQALAGKFGEVSQSRRGSTQSNISRNSVQSWERSQDNSRAASPTKGSPSKPSSPIKEFRPHLPGQWESYATTAMTPSEHSDREKDLGFAKGKGTDKLEDTDLTPTTAKRSVAEVGSTVTSGPTVTEDPIAALKDAGAAMVHSIRQTVGLEETPSEPPQSEQSQTKHGNVYLPRPLQLDRTESSISSMPPTPPAKDTPESEFPPPPPLKEHAPIAPVPLTQLQRPALDPQLSTDTYADDQESDRLRKEIVASLSPIKPSLNPVSDKRVSFKPVSPDVNRASSILPSEYDTYWADEDRASTEHSPAMERKLSNEPETEPAPLPSQIEDPPKPVMLNRFSWEANTPQLQAPHTQVHTVVAPEREKTSELDRIPSPAVERAADEERQQWAEGAPDSYFGPSHTFTVTKPEPITEAELGAQSSATPLDSTRSLASHPQEPPRPTSPGLHVVNTEVDPEAVDLPPRFSAEYQQAPENIQKDVPPPHPQAEFEAPPSAGVSPLEASKPAVGEAHTAKSPTTEKPLGAREIATISSASERIATYNQTRDHWATTDHGLGDWLISTIQGNPELATQTFPVQRVPTGSARHRHTGSLALLGKLGGSSHHEPSAEQFNAAGAQVPAGSTSPTASRPLGPGGFGGRVASQQLKTQGKDLLHTANVLSGKGMTSAKGLFAKGKSRFGREKASSYSRTDSAPSSREVSEEPEMFTARSRTSTAMTMTPEMSLTQFSTETESPSDEKRKRRFSLSSAFRRTSRSRSRPHSIALPSNTPSVFDGTPKGTPSRELPHIFNDGNARPHSYHVLDSWNFAPGVQTTSPEQLASTPPRQQEQSRLGVLPSPAKSAFSSQDRDIEQDVPPVPAIPDEVAGRHYRRMSPEDASHKMLQSVVRYSTPPIAAQDMRALAQSPIISHEDAKAGAEERVTNGTRSTSQPQMKAVPKVPDDHLHPDSYHEDMQQALRQYNDDDSSQARLVREEPVSESPVPPSELHPSHGTGDENFVDDHKLRMSHNHGSAVVDASTHLPVSSLSMGEEDENDFESRNGSPPLDHSAIVPSRGARGLPLPPLETSLENAHREHGPHIAVHDESGEATKVASVGDTAFVLARSPTDRGSARRRPGWDTTEALSPISIHENVDELVMPREQEQLDAATSDVTPLPQSPSESIARLKDSQRLLDYETEVIGDGDVSPVSTRSYTVQDDDAPPKVAKTDAADSVWFAKSELQLPKVRVQAADGPQRRAPDNKMNWPLVDSKADVSGQIAQLSQSGESAHEPGPTRDDSLNPSWPPHAANHANSNQTRRVSATPFQVLHAVEYAASSSSLASWDLDSIATKSHSRSQSGISQLSMMRDDSDLITPVAPVPRITQDSLHPDKAEASHHEEQVTQNTPNGYFPAYTTSLAPMHQPHQMHASKNHMVVPERSRSILSQISAMVSEGGTPISPATSNAGRSTPSTIRRMERDSSTGRALAPAQIPEESATSWNDQTPTGKDDDFDLYADHNGIVKDLHDDRGQPLQVSNTRPAQTPQPIIPPASNTEPVPGSRGSERPRYSTERPMSFISGPPDEHGNPQDQINQYGSASNAQVSSNAQQHHAQLPQPQLPSSGMVSTSLNSAYQPPQRQQPSAAPATAGPGLSNNVPHANHQTFRSSPARNIPVMPSPPPPPLIFMSRASSSGVPVVQGQMPPDSLHRDVSVQDPRMGTAGQPQYIPQTVSTQNSLPTPDHDPRAQGQPTGPRNQYEYHQQMMQQTSYPRPQNQVSTVPSQSFHNKPPAVQDKQSSKPRFSSVFKGLGGKSHQSPQDHVNAPNVAMTKPLPVDPSRGPSLPSAVSSLSTSTGRPIEQTGAPNTFNRPPSMSAESHYSHVSQNSTKVQPADSRLDLRKPASPAPFQGFPPQHPPITGEPFAQPRPSHTATAGVSESGQKKRFSALGALFGRKEEKKVQKASRHSTPPPVTSQVPQAPQQQQFRPQQSGTAYYPPGQLPPHTVSSVQSLGPRSTPPPRMPSVPYPGIQNVPPQRLQQQDQRSQQNFSPQQPSSDARPDPGSAYLRTKQLAEEHRRIAAQSDASLAQTPHPVAQTPNRSFSQIPSPNPSTSWATPPGGYYKPDAKQATTGQGAQAASVAPRQHPGSQGQSDVRHDLTEAERLPAQHQRHQLVPAQGDFRDPRQQQQHQQHPMFRGAYGPLQQVQQPTAEQISVGQRQEQQLRLKSGGYGVPQVESTPSQQRQSRLPSQEQGATNHRSVSGPVSYYSGQVGTPFSQRHVSSPISEHRYESPPIPAAYSHVSGAFVSPSDRYQQPVFPDFQESIAHPSMDQIGGHHSDPRMPSISSQVSEQSQMPPNNRTHSDASTVSVISPISHSPDISAALPPPGQRSQQPRMSSISEVGQQERPWHLNFPEGATEQEIVRARQRQYMSEQFTAQQHLHTERAAFSPSPRASSDESPHATPPIQDTQSPVQGGGFREVQPRSSPQPYPNRHIAQESHVPVRATHSPHPLQPAPIHPGQAPHPAAYPLPMSPNLANITSPVNPMASALPPPPPPKVPHSPMRPMSHPSHSPAAQEHQSISESEDYANTPPPVQQYQAPPQHEQQYEQPVPNEPPPSYDGPGVPHDGMDKNHPDRPRPPNISMDAIPDDRGHQSDPRSRQASIGILQHPQPASMAASPQRSSADMGAESLRKQLLQQEEYARMERIQRAQIQRAESERERQEREAARARARELERSATGGGQVGSLRSVDGSRNGGTPGWERRGSSSRPVFELPAVEDDEPTMKATSYPGQEWVPPMWTDD